jgi:vacuolar-type H+-ATPase subunit I/STV1
VQWLAVAVGMLGLLFSFYMTWKREGIIQAILNLICFTGFMFTVINPFTNTFHSTLFIPALSIAIISSIVSFRLWLRAEKQKRDT